MSSENEAVYTNSTGTIRYYRAPALYEPLGTPKKLWLPILLFAAVAAIAASIWAHNFIDDVVNAEERQSESIQLALGSAQDARVPTLIYSCLGVPEEARNYFANDYGRVVYDIEDSDLEGEENLSYVDFIALPVSLDQEMSLKAASEGIDTLTPADAVVYLKEMWRMTFSTSQNIDIRIRYQDFEAVDVKDAISRAISYQEWQNSVYAESGEDNLGNTYQTGTIEVEGTPFRWSVYACPLSDVYDVKGLPENSYYVSVRMTS